MSSRAGLDDTVIMVTGGAGGIGGAVAHELATRGAKLCLVGRTRGSLEKIAAGLPSPTEVLAADLTSGAALDQLIVDVGRLYGDRLDVLVHCAGMYRRAAIQDADPEDFDRQWAANVLAPYRLTRALLPRLEASEGQVVFVNSTQGLEASPMVGQFAATQHALKAIADSLRAEVNEHGIRVLTVHVGRTATARQERIFRTEGRVYHPELLIQPQDVASVIACCLSLPRTAEVTSLNIRPMAKTY